MAFRVKAGERPKVRVSKRAARRAEMRAKFDKMPRWMFFELPLAGYFLVYVALDVWIAYTGSQNTSASMPYDPVLLIVLTEITKALISGSLYILVFRTESNIFFRKRAMWFMVPAIMFTLWYIVNFAALETTSFPAYQLLYQLNVIILPLIWNRAFKKGAIRPLQWFIIFLLMGACMLIRTDNRFLNPDSDVNEGGTTDGMLKSAFTPTWGWLLVILQAAIGSLVGVLNEYLYKNRAFADIEINQQNTYLYTFTAGLSLFYTLCLWMVGDKKTSPSTFLHGADASFFLIVFLGAVLGLIVAVILKRTNNIIKLFAQALHVPVQMGINYAVLGGEDVSLTWWKTGIGSLIVVLATIAYHFVGGWHLDVPRPSGRKFLRKGSKRWAQLGGPAKEQEYARRRMAREKLQEAERLRLEVEAQQAANKGGDLGVRVRTSLFRNAMDKARSHGRNATEQERKKAVRSLLQTAAKRAVEGERLEKSTAELAAAEASALEAGDKVASANARAARAAALMREAYKQQDEAVQKRRSSSLLDRLFGQGSDSEGGEEEGAGGTLSDIHDSDSDSDTPHPGRSRPLPADTDLPTTAPVRGRGGMLGRGRGGRGRSSLTGRGGSSPGLRGRGGAGMRGRGGASFRGSPALRGRGGSSFRGSPALRGRGGRGGRTNRSRKTSLAIPADDSEEDANSDESELALRGLGAFFGSSGSEAEREAKAEEEEEKAAAEGGGSSSDDSMLNNALAGGLSSSSDSADLSSTEDEDDGDEGKPLVSSRPGKSGGKKGLAALFG